MLILDFYVDEPACFGVPPYLSPYCRYVAGALVQGGIPPKEISYLTVDAWRQRGKELPTEPELLIIIAGATVPGKYLGGRLGTVQEIFEILRWRKEHQKGPTLIGGPIRYASLEIRNEIRKLDGFLVRGDVELYAYLLAKEGGRIQKKLIEIEAQSPALGQRRRYKEQVDLWASAGAFLIELHPNFPFLILEIETYRGCTRDVFCSFCTEAYYGKPEFRSIASIMDELSELFQKGARYFRIGRQADLLTYLPYMSDFQNSFPRPRPQSLEALYAGFHKAAPKLKLLHLDNINPGLIATFPKESAECLEIITEYNTPGDTAAMGIESVDMAVIQKNDLKCSPKEALFAIELVNQYGSKRKNGVPVLLPGLNFIHGLLGEGPDTFKKNYLFLKEVLDAGLLLRRINIRKAVAFENTKLDRLQKKASAASTSSFQKAAPFRNKKRGGLLEERFRYFRDKIRLEIDRPMLQKNFPIGTSIKAVIPEAKNQGYILSRPLGSYPVTIKIPDDDAFVKKQLLRFLDSRIDKSSLLPLEVVVVGYEERSLIGLCLPIRINQIGSKSLRFIPGAGKKRAAAIFQKRPIRNLSALEAILEAPAFVGPECWEFSNF